MHLHWLLALIMREMGERDRESEERKQCFILSVFLDCVSFSRERRSGEDRNGSLRGGPPQKAPSWLRFLCIDAESDGRFFSDDVDVLPAQLGL
jgi:hypothetical protein